MSWAYHLGVLCDVSDHVDADEVHKTVSFQLLNLRENEIVLVVICLGHMTRSLITIISKLMVSSYFSLGKEQCCV